MAVVGKISSDPAHCGFKLTFGTQKQASPYKRDTRTLIYKCEKCGGFHLSCIGPPPGTHSALRSRALPGPKGASRLDFAKPKLEQA